MASEKLNKLPSEISTEDLLKSINTPKNGSEPVVEPMSNVVHFLTHYNLQSGAYAVRKTVIYRLYKAWSKDPETRINFSTEVNKYIFSRQIGKNEYYLINKATFKLEHASFELLKSQDKRKSPYYQQHFQNFLSAHNLKAGKTYVPCYAIHFVYQQWVATLKSKSRLSYKSLFQFLQLYLKSKRLDKSRARAFGLSNNIKEYISEEKIKELKEARQRKPKSKNKKPSSKTQP